MAQMDLRELWHEWIVAIELIEGVVEVGVEAGTQEGRLSVEGAHVQSG